jgi:glyceraldehyde 3-phosphate dehydrogenase
MSEETVVRVGINGFGRVGRSAFRAALTDRRVEVVGVNDVAEDESVEYLARYDSVMGRLDAAVEDGYLVARDGDSEARARVTHEREPAALPWGDLGVDVALECTGVFRTREAASAHLDAGAERVVVSAPPKDDATPQIVYGVNEDEYAGERVVSNASCTTNSVAPVAKTLDDAFGLQSGYLTTVHAYTGSQNLIDGPHDSPRRGRAAAENVVPTTTGAAKAVTEVLPGLAGKLDGMAIRVPVPNGSITQLTVDLADGPDAAAINDALRRAADGPMAGVLGYTDDAVVSRDVVGLPVSSYVDLRSTAAVGDGGLATVLAWYDNEFGFASRMLDVASHVAPVASADPAPSPGPSGSK